MLRPFDVEGPLSITQRKGRRPAARVLRAACAIALAGAAALPTTALAADAPGAALDEVVVTARRRAESLQDVPIAVTTFSPEQLERLSATSLKDIKNFVPNLHYSDRSALQTDITIRGVGGDSRNIGIDSGIGLYIDGVYAGRTSAYNLDLADVEQIEVLRGPQGTLFGKNTTGGALNITTRKPGDEFEGSVGLSYGNYQAIRFRGTLGGPITDTISGKVTVATWDRDGYLRNQFNGQRLQGEERRAALVQLRVRPSDALDILFSADWTQDDQSAILNQLGSNAAFGNGFFNPDRFVVNTDQRNSTERDMVGASLSVNYRLDSGYEFASITGYRNVEITVFSDIDQTPRDVFRSGPFTDNGKQYTQEFRITSPGSQFVDWLAGLYYYKQDADATRRIFSNGNPLFFTTGPVDTTSYAAFANATVNFTPKLAFTAGARITHEKKEGSYRQTSPVPPFNKNFPSLEIDTTEPSFTIALNYRWTDEISTYASISDGFKSGGFNVDPLATPAPLTAREITFKPEFVTSYEMGVKSSLLDQRLRLNGAVFYSKFKDRQVPQFETVGTTPTVITRNAGESDVFGVEVELQAALGEYAQIFGGASYMDGEYTQFRNATTAGANYTGNTTEKTPAWSANFGLELRAPAGSGAIVFSPQFAYLGKTFLQPDNGRFNRENGYGLVNLRFGYEANGGRYGVFFWGKNLADTQYKEFARQFSGSDQVLWGEPRTYGIEAVAKF